MHPKPSHQLHDRVQHNRFFQHVLDETLLMYDLFSVAVHLNIGSVPANPAVWDLSGSSLPAFSAARNKTRMLELLPLKCHIHKGLGGKPHVFSSHKEKKPSYAVTMSFASSMRVALCTTRLPKLH